MPLSRWNIAPLVVLVAISPASAQRTATKKAVLLVIAQQDFFYREYSEPKEELEKAGFRVEVAAARKGPCRPHAGTGQTGDGVVQADLAIADASADKYEAIVFAGGWGASMYQYAFDGQYANGAYNGDARLRAATNKLIGDFVKQDKYVCGICHGVSVLAWARVGNKSLLDGKNAAAAGVQGPAMRHNGQQSQPPSRWHAEQNGAKLSALNSVGDPRSPHDDVVVDGKTITAQDDQSARQCGKVLAEQLKK